MTDSRRQPVLRKQMRNTSAIWVALAAGAILLSAGSARAQEEPPGEKTPIEKRDAALDDLGQKLMRKAIDESEEDVMSVMIRLMGESARRLELDFDCGEETQAVQRRVMEELDSAIKEAAARTRRNKSQNQSSSSADKRRKSSEQQPGGQSAKGDEGEKGQAAADGTTESATQLSEAAKAGGDLKESRRAWGNLPPREREEVIQGAEENSLERYRQWIDRYYRALQESAE